MTGKVLCLSSGAVARLYHTHSNGWFCSNASDLAEFQRNVISRFLFVERNRAELDPSFVQLIPSCVVACGPKLLCLRRSADSARTELKSKWTSLFGGHVDEADRYDNGNAWQTILTGVKREIREELGIHINGHTPEFAGLAIDPTSSVGRLHIGVVFFYSVKVSGVRLTTDLDLSEFEISKAGIVRFLSCQEMSQMNCLGQFDPWSTLFLNSDFAREKLHPDFREDTELPLLRAAR